MINIKTTVTTIRKQMAEIKDAIYHLGRTILYIGIGNEENTSEMKI
tara:strand:- start:830 stop:967 length:138 start_codon:yes stop_codon:yes gene_type:complete